MSIERRMRELRRAREELREAAEALGERWEEPCLPAEAPELRPGAAGGTWSPRQALEHAVAAQLLHHYDLVSALLELESPEAAVQALDEWGALLDGTAELLGDDDLALEAPLAEGQLAYLEQQGVEGRRDVDSLLRLASLHLRDHATQLRRAAEGRLAEG